MPEGHTIHRLAAALSELYAGRRLAVSSPQGRFAAGAARLNGLVLLGARAHGKHLFLPFAPAADLPLDDGAVVWLRVHLGLYGAWTFDGDAEFTAPHAIGAPRRRVGERGEHALRHGGGSALSGLSGGDDAAAPAPGLWEPPEHGVADLTGPAACELLDAEGLAAVRRRLGPDPLRADGDIEVFVAGVRRRRRPIGELLMDQSVISGVGNIFRAETLLRCGVSPFRAGSRLSADRVRSLWRDLVPLMEYGVATGFITTVDAVDVPDPLPEGDEEAARWYVYHRTGRPCLRCGSPVRERTAAGRRLFWCAACQR